MAHKVALIDDDEYVINVPRQYLRSVLPNAEYSKAFNGVDGRLIAREADLIVSDQHMPLMNGMDMLNTLSMEVDLTRKAVMLWSGKDFNPSEMADFEGLWGDAQISFFTTKPPSDTSRDYFRQWVKASVVELNRLEAEKIAYQALVQAMQESRMLEEEALKALQRKRLEALIPTFPELADFPL